MKVAPQHLPSTVVPLQDGLRVEGIELDDEVLTLTLAAGAPVACCPVCATPSAHLHSHYHRHATDLPWGSLMVRLSLWVRRFRRGKSDCPRRIFTERLPHLLGPYARRTLRAQEVVRAIALALGGEGGARLSTQLHLPLSAATLRRLIRRLAVPAAAPRVIGVDDFALRRQREYGTVIADMETHTIIDLLPDRTALTLAAWLRRQPQIEIVSRDRSTEYAHGIDQGAPQAQQVAGWRTVPGRRGHAVRGPIEPGSTPPPDRRIPTLTPARAAISGVVVAS